MFGRAALSYTDLAAVSRQASTADASLGREETYKVGPRAAITRGGRT